ncbi:hypothetical protein Btru_074452 [Bulinus truncatus]|nr:hypothetical protein Btru_074452 [Bulinus truncatus]
MVSHDLSMDIAVDRSVCDLMDIAVDRSVCDLMDIAVDRSLHDFMVVADVVKYVSNVGQNERTLNLIESMRFSQNIITPVCIPSRIVLRMAALNLQSDASVYVHDSLSDTTGDQIYGDHETQVSEGQEADLHRHIVECEKNPGHKNFIPVNEFNLYHLPEGHLDKDL